MIVSFGNKIASELWEHDLSKGFPRELHVRAKALLTIMHATNRLGGLRLKGQPPNIRLHKLKGERKNQWSITLRNDSPWRITFEFSEGEFSEVRIENYHKG